MEMQDTPQFQTDMIDSLPVSNINQGNNDLSVMFNIPEEDLSNDKFKREILEIGLIIVIFIFVSLPFVTDLLHKQFGDSVNIVLATRATLFAFLYYVVKNTYLK